MAGTLEEFVARLTVADLARLAGKSVEDVVALTLGAPAARPRNGTRRTMYSASAHPAVLAMAAKDAAATGYALEPLDLDPRRVVARIEKLGDLDASERATVYLLLYGASDREIAKSLGCGERTAKRLVGRLMSKFDMPNRSGLLGVLLEDAGHNREEVMPEVEAARRTRAQRAKRTKPSRQA